MSNVLVVQNASVYEVSQNCEIMCTYIFHVYGQCTMFAMNINYSCHDICCYILSLEIMRRSMFVIQINQLSLQCMCCEGVSVIGIMTLFAINHMFICVLIFALPHMLC